MRIATAIRSLILAAAVSAIPAASFAGVFVSIGFGAPPVLPVYAQPICPAPGYIWTPGYWAYDEGAGYFWVPGAWVLAPYEGALWTPGYWGWGNGGYLWNAGYWGRHVGFYGGVNYGFGYYGRGFEGGYWDHNRFRYNRAVMNVRGDRFHDVYDRRVDHRDYNRVSFNGGRGGLNARPTREEQNWGREQHMAPLGAQHQNEMRASQNRQQFASVNHGRPENLARTQPVAYNRNVPTGSHTAPISNRPANTGVMTSNPTHTAPVGNINRSAPLNNTQRPVATNQNFNRAQGNNNASRPPVQTYRPQSNMQMNQHTQPQPMRAPAQQAYRPQSNMQMNQHTQPQQMRAPAQQAYHPQSNVQMNQRAQPQTMRAPQQSRPEPSHSSNGGGHGGHGR